MKQAGLHSLYERHIVTYPITDLFCPKVGSNLNILNCTYIGSIMQIFIRSASNQSWQCHERAHAKCKTLWQPLLGYKLRILSSNFYCSPVSVYLYCRTWRQPGLSRGLKSKLILTNESRAIEPSRTTLTNQSSDFWASPHPLKCCRLATALLPHGMGHGTDKKNYNQQRIIDLFIIIIRNILVL